MRGFRDTCVTFRSQTFVLGLKDDRHVSFFGGALHRLAPGWVDKLSVLRFYNVHSFCYVPLISAWTVCRPSWLKTKRKPQLSFRMVYPRTDGLWMLPTTARSLGYFCVRSVMILSFWTFYFPV